MIIYVTGFFVQDDGRMLADDLQMSFLTLCICINSKKGIKNEHINSRRSRLYRKSSD